MRRMSSWKQSGDNPTADQQSIALEVARIASLDLRELRAIWRNHHGRDAPKALSKDLLIYALAYEHQEGVLGTLAPNLERLLGRLSEKNTDRDRAMKVGSVIVREYQGEFHEVTIVPDGFSWRGEVYGSLSSIAKAITGTKWNGRRFFGVQKEKGKRNGSDIDNDTSKPMETPGQLRTLS